MEGVKDIVSDEEVAESFKGTNFGSMSGREVIRHGCLKIAGGFYQGHTSNTILVELGLKKSYDKNELTKKGRRYLYYAYNELEPTSGV